MRSAFINSLMEVAERDPSIWLLNADLGYSVLEPFAEKFPDRYLNVGVAEQNMIGVSAGLAMTGAKVFVYSIANFPTQRCLEQIRVDVCYHQLHVVVVAVGGGFAYGAQGYTHHAIEDLAVMRSLPGMRVAAPSDPHEARAIVRHFADMAGPGYLRLGRNGEAEIHDGPLDSESLPPLLVRAGEDVAIFTTGAILGEAIKAAELLATYGVSARITSIPMLKPLDTARCMEATEGVRLIVTVEEHSVIGGLGETMASVLAKTASRPPLLSLGVADGATRGKILGQDEMRKHCGLDAASIANEIRTRISNS